MRLFVGLGNPGQKYQNNRHNIGFMAMDEICHRHKFTGWSSKFSGELSSGTIEGEKVLLLKPMTFMNLSGQSVQGVSAFYKIPIENVIVFHDELDLQPNKIRIKRGGGSGGHNGIKSIDQHLGADYWRVRLGIGHPGDKDMVSPYVLGDFAKAELQSLEKFIRAIGDHSGRLAMGDNDGFMTRVAKDLAPPRPPKEDKKETPQPEVKTKEHKDGI